MQTLHNMWIFSLTVKLKTVILVFDILDNTRCNIAWKDETEQYNDVLNLRKCKYDFSVYQACTFQGPKLKLTQTLRSMWTFLLLVKLKTVIFIFGNFDNTQFNIAWKDETEQYNFVLNLRKCKYDFYVY